jgi:ATP phosphoribosyltransferase
MRYITFALAKGRLAKKAMALLEEIGITCEEMKDKKINLRKRRIKIKIFLIQSK